MLHRNYFRLLTNESASVYTQHQKCMPIVEHTRARTHTHTHKLVLDVEK